MKYLMILHKGWPQWDIYLAAQCTIKCNGFGLLMLSLDEPENRLFSWEIPIAGRFPWNMFVCMQYKEQCSKGPFNNYVDKMREGRGSKNVCFCPRSGYRNCPRRGGQKMAKFGPRSCCMTPKCDSYSLNANAMLRSISFSHQDLQQQANFVKQTAFAFNKGI